MKDYLRLVSRNDAWPDEIWHAGYTASQRTGGGQCFEFVKSTRDVPFPDDFAPTGKEPVFIVQTLSLPLATREILRMDEQSLAQVVVKLNVLEHLLSSAPPDVREGTIELTHLQNNVKLRATEIDALYKVTAIAKGASESGLMTVEVKLKDPIIREQIEKQALSALKNPSFRFCIPVVLKRYAKGEVTALLFRRLDEKDVAISDDGSEVVPLVVAYSAKYVFEPSIKAL
ncbi:MAG TPA: hypothetical protein VG407_08380 [Caulobacteraceae bacterium]|nr:hypothetical protein [Caulobacteraceae bacterium]